MDYHSPRQRYGFTRVGLLVVMVILGTATALGVVGYQKVREVKQRTECSDNLRRIGLAMLRFEETNNGFPSEQRQDLQGKSFYVQLLANLDLQELAPNGLPDAQGQARPFVCPARRTAAEAPGARDYGYAASKGNKKSILDSGPKGVPATEVANLAGTPFTALLGHIWTSPASYATTTPGWASPTGHAVSESEQGYKDTDPSGNGFLGSPHPNVMPMLFADGHAKPIAYSAAQFVNLFDYTNTTIPRL